MKFYPMPHYQMRKHMILAILNKYRCNGKKLLEIGYGAGEIFKAYIDKGIAVFGYDFSEDAYLYVQKRFPNQDKIILYKEEKELIEQSYDFVVACEVLEHIEDDRGALIKWNQYIKEQGYLILSVPLHQNRWGVSDEAFGHFRRYEMKEIFSLLSSCGYKTLDSFSYDFPSCFVLDKLRNYRIRSVTQKYIEPNSNNKKVQGTKISGIARDENRIIEFFSHPFFIYPVIFMQKLFIKTDWGSSAIIVAKKQTTNRNY